jgi:hypothetical protein
VNKGIVKTGNTDIFIKWIYECKKSGADTVVMHNSKGLDVKLNYMEGFKSFNEIIKVLQNILIEYFRVYCLK